MENDKAKIKISNIFEGEVREKALNLYLEGETSGYINQNKYDLLKVHIFQSEDYGNVEPLFVFYGEGPLQDKYLVVGDDSN